MRAIGEYDGTKGNKRHFGPATEPSRLASQVGGGVYYVSGIVDILLTLRTLSETGGTHDGGDFQGRGFRMASIVSNEIKYEVKSQYFCQTVMSSMPRIGTRGIYTGIETGVLRLKDTKKLRHPFFNTVFNPQATPPQRPLSVSTHTEPFDHRYNLFPLDKHLPGRGGILVGDELSSASVRTTGSQRYQILMAQFPWRGYAHMRSSAFFDRQKGHCICLRYSSSKSSSLNICVEVWGFRV